MILTVKTALGAYDVVIGEGCAEKAGELLELDRKALIVTDDGVPAEKEKKIAEKCREAYIRTVQQGEGSKSVAVWEKLLAAMLEKGFTRSDCVIAVGGGVVGDLAGFVAASYMRGVDFYNLPTTVLSQVDSSIGGKTAVNFGGVKNIVGAFYPPKKVLVDPAFLKTLPMRQIANGLAEALKMAVTFDEEFFTLFEKEDPFENLAQIVARSLEHKKRVVEEDEREGGARRVLNFGHTIGHAIESEEGLSGLLHGECVALGMLPMCAPEVRARLLPVYRKLGLPTTCALDADKLAAAMAHDKKAAGRAIKAVFVDRIGTYRITEVGVSDLCARLSCITYK